MTTRFVHDGWGDVDGDGIPEHYSTETDVGIAPNPSRTTKTIYDNRGRKKKVIAPDGKTTTENFYNEQDQLVATQTLYEGALQTCTVTYRDNRDRVERVRVQNAPFGTEPTLFSDTYTLYNKAGSVVQTVDPLGNVLDRDSPAHKRTFILDERERVTLELDGQGDTVRRNIYGDDDLLIEIHLPDPEKKTPMLVPSEYRTYTARKELKTSTNRDGFGLTYDYTPIQGQVDKVTDALGRVTKTTYWPDTRRVDEVIVAEGTPNERRTKSVWEQGLLVETRVWNPETLSYNASYRQFYDQADRLERFEAPLVAAERHFYNEFGEESRFVAGGKAVDHAYNQLGQRTGSAWSGAFSASEGRTYNGLGLLESVSAEGRTKSMQYDLWLGTLRSETFEAEGASWRKSQSHLYDAAKNYTGFTDAEGGRHEWLYDGNNRVFQIKYGNALVATIQYTPGGLVDSTTLHDASGAPIARTTHLYDRLGRKVRAQTVRVPTGEVVADFGWGYDELDLVRRIEYLHLGVETLLDYNERRELVKEALSSNDGGRAAPPYENQIGAPAAGPESEPTAPAQATPHGVMAVEAREGGYHFDPAGNRDWQKIGEVETTLSYNAASQLIGEAAPGRSVSHEYDEWGNEKRRTTTETSQVVEEYTYNYLNLMSGYENLLSGARWAYDFWPTGERYSKTNLGTNVSELYIPRGGDVAAEYDKSASGPISFKNAYVQGTGVDQKYVRIPANNGLRRHYLGDQVGTISLTLGDDGAVAETSLKDAWGVQLSGGTPSERYGFAQREHDPESGLVHMRARMYDPRLGRFTQVEPILGNRPTEHYAYVMNNPVIQSDPSGEQALPIPPGENMDWWRKYSGAGGAPPDDFIRFVIEFIPGKGTYDAFTDEGLAWYERALYVASEVPWAKFLKAGKSVKVAKAAVKAGAVAEAAEDAEKAAKALKAVEKVEGAAQEALHATKLETDAQRIARLRKARSELEANMKAAGIKRPPDSDLHHIVALDSPNAAKARAILGKHGIGLSEAANGVLLPATKEAAGKAMYHPSLHTRRYYEIVEVRLAKAASKQEALAVLNRVKEELIKGKFPK